jgi:uncharacterized membrane protein
MKTNEFIERVNHDEITRAIRESEARTSGEIRVFITRHPVETPVAAAEECFLAQGMDQTRDRNAVLIFVAPRNQKFAVVGDVAVHHLCGEVFWQELSTEIGEHFRKADFTGGLLVAIRHAGDLLARHFPRKPDDQNELPDRVIRD